MKEVDRSKLTIQQLAQLEQYHASRKQLETLNDIADMFQEVLSVLSDNKEEESLNNLGTLLLDIRETLAEINGKEAPEVEDKTKDVVASVVKLEKSLSTTIKALELSPQINIAAPNVKVDVPTIDLKGMEKLLKMEIPKAFESAVKSIPKIDILKTDNTELLVAWEGISQQLLSIENATRMKPLPGSMQVSNNVSVINPNGSYVGTPLFTKPYDRLIVTYTDSTKTVIATIVSKLLGTTQETITNNSNATTDDLVRT